MRSGPIWKLVGALTAALLVVAACNDDTVGVDEDDTETPTEDTTGTGDDATDDDATDDDATDDDATDEEAAPVPRNGDSRFCGQLEAVAEIVTEFDQEFADDDAFAAAGALYERAIQAFRSTDPPAELRDDWELIRESIEDFAAVFGGYDPDDPAAAEGFAEELARIEERAGAVEEAMQRVATHARDECGVELER